MLCAWGTQAPHGLVSGAGGWAGAEARSAHTLLGRDPEASGGCVCFLLLLVLFGIFWAREKLTRTTAHPAQANGWLGQC